MTTPDTTTPEATTDEKAATTATAVVEAEPAAPETTSEAQAETGAPTTEIAVETAPVTEQAAPAAEATAVAVAAPAAAETAVAAPAAAEEEDPQTTVFSLLTFFLAALPVIGVVLNAIAVARAGKEGFDLWLARWGLALAIIETIGALALVGLGYYLGTLTVG